MDVNTIAVIAAVNNNKNNMKIQKLRDINIDKTNALSLVNHVLFKSVIKRPTLMILKQKIALVRCTLPLTSVL
jgi:hypothetical protein